MSDADMMLSAIERKGWRMTALETGWRCQHPATDQTFFLSFTQSWACLQRPVQLAASDPQVLTDIYRMLLRRNEMLFLARYALDPALQPVLMLELPRSGGLPLIDTALAALARYADPAGEVPGVSKPAERAAHSLATQAAPGLAEETVAYYVRAVEGRGWGLRGKPSGITWPLGYKGQRLFDVFFTVSQTWAYFQVPMLPGPPAALASQNGAVQQAFLRHMLRVNEAWYMVKLGLAESGQPLLMLEVPTQDLDFDLFRLCTRLIASYLDFYARELQIMAELERDHRLSAWLLAG